MTVLGSWDYIGFEVEFTFDGVTPEAFRLLGCAILWSVPAKAAHRRKYQRRRR